jgi:hypothetical protein
MKITLVYDTIQLKQHLMCLYIFKNCDRRSYDDRIDARR